MRYDLAITGSGGAAFAAAITARDAGASVVMIERGTIGGTCVDTGCVPSKALLAAAAARHDAASQRFPGIATQAGPVDMAALTGGKDDLVAAMRAGKYTGLAADYGWQILAGTARFAGGPDAPVLQVRLNEGGTATVEAGHYLVATGTAPWIPPIRGLAGAGYLTSATAIEDVLDEEGISILTAAAITSVQGDATSRSVTIKTAGAAERELAYGQILVAAGRHPVTAGLNVDAAGVKTGGRGEIITDESGRTANARIWAAGDVTGGPQFVYVAAAQGSAAAANALFNAERTVDYTALPRVTFTSPAIASSGMTEAELIRQGVACDCRVLPLSAVPRAVVARDTRWMVKLVAEAGTGRVRGVHAVADGAGEMITAASYAIRARMTVADLAAAWAPYLTMSEGLRLAAQAFSRDVSRLSCCAA